MAIEQTDIDELTRLLYDELRVRDNAIAAGLARSVEFLAVAPAKPREGMVTGADGAPWNPGAGKWIYCYYTGAWHLLG